jgi:chromosome segregation ATPase
VPPVSPDGGMALQDRPRRPSEWMERVWILLQRDLGRLEGRLERTQIAESTLREQLERERSRADRLEEEQRELRTELEEARPWWRRLFE